jgi:hypothetical protein
MVITDRVRKEIERVMPGLIDKFGYTTWYRVYDEMKKTLEPKDTNVLPREVQTAAERLGYECRDIRLTNHHRETIAAYSNKREKIPMMMDPAEYFFICQLSDTIRKSFRR